ncbi:MAG: chemotaxis protein CheB [Polyangiales bacterium]
MVGIGASAGGLSALERLVERLSVDTPASFIIVQHLSPEHKSLMAEILGRRTRLQVREAEDGMRLEPRVIYLVPPRKNIEVVDHALRFRERAGPHAINLPVDLLLRSLATDVGARAVAVVLSGTGSDGRIGVEAVKAAGGTVIVQSPQTARFDGMPLAALSTGKVDAVLPPEEIADRLEAVFRGELPADEDAVGGDVGGDETPLDAVFLTMLRETGVDFHEYKLATVMRRIERRMTHLGLARLEDYVARLKVDRPEVHALVGEMLVSVTRFFRDEDVWELVRTSLFPRLASSRNGPLRLWVAGCATGPEAYTIAMLFAEAIEEARASVDYKIFATDLDREALARASAGVYSAEALADVSPARVERFFEARGSDYIVSRELRRRVVFAEHNLTRDPAFTRLDFVSCRNVLIYMKPALQQRVLASLTFALKPDGALLLGPSETLGDVDAYYRPIDAQRKLFSRLPGRPLLPSMLASEPARPLGEPSVERTPSQIDMVTKAAFRILVERVAPASVLVDDAFDIVQVFGNAGGLLSLPLGDPTRSLLSFLPDSHRAVVATALRRARDTAGEVRFAVVGHMPQNVLVERIDAPRSGQRFYLVVLENAPMEGPTAAPTERQTQVELLERELLFTRESLQATIEELETSNEELQATNEELVASNEELQSTNEELSSVNEELSSVNAEHQAQIQELSQLNDDLDHLFRATTVGTLFLDEELAVRRFSTPVTAVFPLQGSDLRRPIRDIASRLVGQDFETLCAGVLRNGQEVEREVETLDRGRYLMRVAPYLHRRRIAGVVANFVDTTPIKTALTTVHRLQRIIDSLPMSTVIVDGEGRIGLVNAPWRRFAAESFADPPGWEGVDYLAASAANHEVVAGLKAVLAREVARFSHEYPCHSPTARRWFRLDAAPLDGEPGAVITHTDVTERKLLEGA